MTDNQDQGHDGDFVQSLERGLSVIRAFDAEHPSLTLSEVATSTGLSRAAARRFLRTLVQLGYMRIDGSRFALRPKILELGYAYLSSLTLPEVAMPHLEQLVEQVHESSSVSELDGDDVIYIARVPTKRIMTVTISVGTRFPAYATSMGRVLLAAQPDEWLDEYLGSVSLRRTAHRSKRTAGSGAAPPPSATGPGTGRLFSYHDSRGKPRPRVPGNRGEPAPPTAADSGAGERPGGTRAGPPALPRRRCSRS